MDARSIARECRRLQRAHGEVIAGAETASGAVCYFRRPTRAAVEAMRAAALCRDAGARRIARTAFVADHTVSPARADVEAMLAAPACLDFAERFLVTWQELGTLDATARTLCGEASR